MTKLVSKTFKQTLKNMLLVINKHIDTYEKHTHFNNMLDVFKYFNKTSKDVIWSIIKIIDYYYTNNKYDGFNDYLINNEKLLNYFIIYGLCDRWGVYYE